MLFVQSIRLQTLDKDIVIEMTSLIRASGGDRARLHGDSYGSDVLD